MHLRRYIEVRVRWSYISFHLNQFSGWTIIYLYDGIEKIKTKNKQTNEHIWLSTLIHTS